MNPEMLEGIQTPFSLGRVRKIATSAEGYFIEVLQRVSLDFYMNDVLFLNKFLIIQRLSEDAIIGAAT